MCKPGAACGCSGGGSGAGLALLAAAAVIAAGAVAAFVVDYATLILALAVLTAAGTFAAVRLLSRHMVVVYRPAPPPPAPRVRVVRALPAAPLAIEAPRPGYSRVHQIDYKEAEHGQELRSV